MREIYKKKRSLGILVLLTMIVQIFVPFLETGKVYAKNGDQIVQKLEIVGGVKGEYRPGETIVVKGDWKLPNDSPNSEYVEGDSFSISIPKGLTPAFGKITLGDMGEGRVVGDKVIFTFNENIEQLMNRNGGFTLMFTVDTPDKEGESELPLTFKDDEGKELISENSKVNYEKGEVIGTSKENVGKGKSDNVIEDGLEWYIRLNWSNELKDEGWVTLVDNIVGDNHIIKEGSFRVESMYTNYQPVNKEAEYTKPIISPDGKQFTMDLKIEDDILYTIYYETKYVGDYSKDIENADKYNNIKLKNELAVYTKNKGVLYPENKSESEPVEGEFNLGGWAEGDSWGSAYIKKVDSVTGKALEGAKFEYYHVSNPEKIKTAITDKEGKAQLYREYKDPYGKTIEDKNMKGSYVIKEIEAPDGYILNNEEITVLINKPETEIIIENKPEPIDIKVKKEWFDSEGNDIDSQEDIVVKLLANDKPIRQAVLKANETLTFKNLDKKYKDEDGKVKDVEYQIEEYVERGDKLFKVTDDEENGTGYISDIKDTEEGFTITNTQVVRDIKVSKTWKDVSKDTDLPEVIVKLLADGKEVEDKYSLKLNSDNEWQGKFEDLPKYDESGKEIKYSVKEYIEVDGGLKEVTKEENNGTGYISDIKDTEEGFTITNTYNPGKLSIPVTKAWEGVSEDTDLPEVTVKLLANGKEVEGIGSLNLNSDNEWQGEFKDLPKYDESGEKIEYSVKEVDIPNGYTSEVIEDEEGFTIINTYNPGKLSIPVKKVWKDSSENELEDTSNLPEVTVKLLANGKEVEGIDSLNLKSDNEWQGEFKGLPKYDESGEEIKYEVKEYIEIAGKLTEVTKEENNGTGYTSVIEGNAKEGFTITNTEIKEPESETTSVSVTKVWKGTALDSVTVKLLANGEIKATVQLDESNGWEHTFKGLAKTDQDGNKLEYTVEEVEVEGYTSVIKGNAKEGFTITNTKIEEPKPESKTTSVSVSKVWKGTALDNVTVKLLANGKFKDTVQLDESKSWKHTFTGLEKIDKDGKKIVYTVKEEVPEGYTAKITGNAKDGFTITNTKDPEPVEPEDPKPVEPEDPPKPDKPIEPEPAPETVSLTVKKAWVGEPTERVLVQLVANGQGLEVVELRESNNWTHVFINLVKYNSDGSEIEYSVVEIDVPDGYTEEYSRPEEDTILITNIKDEEPEEPEPIIPEPEEPEEPETPEPVEPEEPETPEPVEPEEPETPEPVEPEEPETPEPVEPEEPETPEPVEPEEPENPEEDGDGSKNPNKPGDEEPEEDVDGVIVEKPEDPEEDGSGSKNPNKPGDKEQTETDASQETKLPKTGSNSLDYYLLGLLLLLIGLLLKKRERVAN